MASIGPATGHMAIMLVAFMVVIMPIFSYISERIGYQGVFLALAVTVSVGALTILFLPDQPNKELEEKVSGIDMGAETIILSVAV